MDVFGAISAAVAWFTANWSTLEGLARNLAINIGVLYGLAFALAKAMKPFFPEFGAKAERKLLGVFQYQDK